MTLGLRLRDLRREWSVFLREARHNWHTTGAVAPSTRWLAAAMVFWLRHREGDAPVRIAEVGPGTGAFTREIGRQMREGDELHVFDVNRTFLSHVERLVAAEPIFDGKSVSLHELDARFLDTRGRFDVLISGLPFTNFHPELVKAILDAYIRAVGPGGRISWFAYAGARAAKKLVSPRHRRRELSELDDLLRAYLAAYQVREDAVLRNIPPAIVHHLRVS